MKPVRITDAYEVREFKGSREGRQLAQLLKPLEYRVGSADSDVKVIVPKDYVTDFASVPRGMWNIFPPLGPWARAAIIHDYIYDTKGCFGKFTRKQADKIFLEAMEVLDVPKIKRETMYRAVRLNSMINGDKWNA